jgi:two-component system alkaline phosphatase synthesis response regulator PhoP
MLEGARMNDMSAQKKILIVDDDPAVCNMLEKLLKVHSYSTLTAQDGLQALNTARTGKPDLIILDVMLPGMDGYKVCRWIKFDQQLKKIPVMILTSRMSPQDEQLAFECGADAFVTKAVKTEVIVSHVKKLLEL